MPKTLTGLVVSDGTKRDKTLSVMVKRRYMQPRYKKYVSAEKKYHVHDPMNQYRIGATVEIIQCRPFSKTKKWIVGDVANKA